MSWVKLHRSLINDIVFDDPEVLKVWIWILCKVSYKNKTEIEKKQVVKLEPGQMIVKSRKEAAEELKISENKYRKSIELLKKLGCITKKSTNKFTVINVVKWEFFQGDADKNNQQNTNKPPTKHQQTTSHKYKKNIKNDKNINNYNAHARERECVPAPKSTKFNNFTPSGNVNYKELEMKALRERIARNEQIQE